MVAVRRWRAWCKSTLEVGTATTGTRVRVPAPPQQSRCPRTHACTSDKQCSSTTDVADCCAHRAWLLGGRQRWTEDACLSSAAQQQIPGVQGVAMYPAQPLDSHTRRNASDLSTLSMVRYTFTSTPFRTAVVIGQLCRGVVCCNQGLRLSRTSSRRPSTAAGPASGPVRDDAVTSVLHETLVLVSFQLLDAASLASASRVCRRWRLVCHRDVLWQRLCDHEGYCHAGATATADSPPVLWRQLYIACESAPQLDLARTVLSFENSGK